MGREITGRNRKKRDKMGKTGRNGKIGINVKKQLGSPSKRLRIWTKFIRQTGKLFFFTLILSYPTHRVAESLRILQGSQLCWSLDPLSISDSQLPDAMGSWESEIHKGLTNAADLLTPLLDSALSILWLPNTSGRRVAESPRSRNDWQGIDKGSTKLSPTKESALSILCWSPNALGTWDSEIDKGSTNNQGSSVQQRSQLCQSFVNLRFLGTQPSQRIGWLTKDQQSWLHTPLDSALSILRQSFVDLRFSESQQTQLPNVAKGLTKMSPSRASALLILPWSQILRFAEFESHGSWEWDPRKICPIAG